MIGWLEFDKVVWHHHIFKFINVIYVKSHWLVIYCDSDKLIVILINIHYYVFPDNKNEPHCEIYKRGSKHMDVVGGHVPSHRSIGKWKHETINS
jgi:hypothetical protein